METCTQSSKNQESQRVNTLQKLLPIRDKKYIKFIREFSCVVCQAPPPSDPHHSETGGRGTKASDTTCIPLCHRHHFQVHQVGKQSFAKMYDIDYYYTTERLKGIYYGTSVQEQRSQNLWAM